MKEIAKENNQKKYYSLLELTSSIKSVIKKTYTRSYWVKAEIARLNYYPKSGHCYPDLVEKENGVVLAQMRGTIWAGHFNDINSKFQQVTKEPLADGMTVLFRASVSFHPVYGFGLQISDIEPSFTLGEMAKEKQMSIEKLRKEGIYNANKKLVPALLMQRIAVVSVETSKGYQDFLKIIEGNEWGYKFFHMLFPALLQGDNAINSITGQLGMIKKVKSHFDVVIIIRGGGGDIGLSSYDSYKLAKSVALFPLPVITGIGHATNETVVEMVAFLNKITPTDVGYFLIQRFHNFSVRVQNAQDTLIDKSKQITNNEKQVLKNMSGVLKNNTISLIHRERIKLSTDNHRFNRQVTSFLQKRKMFLTSLYSVMLHKPKQLISVDINLIQQLGSRLASSVKANMLANTIVLSSLSDKLRLLEPKNILKRGYSITIFKGKTLTSTTSLNVDDIVETQTYNGAFKSKVQSIDKSDK